MRDKIIREVRRIAKARDGRPPGRKTFEKESGIKESAWYGILWVRWGDALVEAGFQANERNARLDDRFLMGSLIKAFRHFNREPTVMELRMYRKLNPDFPNENTAVKHFGSKENMRRKLFEWAQANEGHEDILAMLPDIRVSTDVEAVSDDRNDGFVYLIGSGDHYKIGKCSDLERRIKEIRVALPEAAKLVHSIRTDDPSGIEAYWHQRFANRRANGEWFRLTRADVAAFKRRKYQ